MSSVTDRVKLGVLWFGVLLGGCVANPEPRIFDGGSQVETRSYQTRAFDTTDREKTLRAIIATLQDLGFVIDKADATLGTVSGTKLADYQVRMTVSVRPRGETQLLVRASAQYSQPQLGKTGVAVEDPETYQDFFNALGQAMFLAAQQVD